MLTVYPEVKEALFEACMDLLCGLGHTPYIQVLTAHNQFIGPRELESEAGMTVFNIGGTAVNHYDVSEDGLTFGAKFKGVHHDMFVPWAALVTIFAKEDFQLHQKFAVDVSDVITVDLPEVEEPVVTLVSSIDKPKPSGASKFRPTLVPK